VRPGAQTAKVLEWVSDITPAESLRTLLVEVDNITIQPRGVPVPFQLDEVDPL